VGLPGPRVEDESAIAVSLNGAKIRAVTFDVGHTLIEPRDSVGNIYAEIAARHGRPGLAPAELDRRFLTVLQARGGAVNTRTDWEEIVDDTFAGLISPLPSATFFPELFERFARASEWRIYDDVLPTLEALARRGVRLGIISNWDDRLRPLLAALNLASHFEVAMISAEFGCSKPAREIFDSMAHLLGLPPAEILHVGDSWSADVAGARAAGFQACQIARNAPADSDRVGSLVDLVDLVSQAGG
jgi:putative hydrolase of the HAD superfamily